MSYTPPTEGEIIEDAVMSATGKMLACLERIEKILITSIERPDQADARRMAEYLKETRNAD